MAVTHISREKVFIICFPGLYLKEIIQSSITYPWEVHKVLWVACPWVEEAYQEVVAPLIEMILVEQDEETP